MSTTSTDSESTSSLGPSSKKPKRASKWQHEWKRYNMSESRKGPSFVHCDICGTDFSIASGGSHEVKRHVEGKRHVERAREAVGQSSITDLFQRDRDSVGDKTTAAEIYFATFIAEHNLPFLTADHFTKLCKKMFPDSKIAEGFACGRTKTTAIVKCTLAPALNAEVVAECQNSPFTILCDGGNDIIEKKYFAIMVRYWSQSARQPITRFLCMPICNIATAEALFEALSKELESRNLPWSNVIGYASDTCSVMVGTHNSVLSRLHEKQPKVFSLGCLCHLAALCATAAVKTLPVSVDDLLIDIYYHFKHSAKKWSEFAEIRAEFSEIKPLRILKHSTTRWLSLQRCIIRLLDQWPALYSYFDRQSDIEPTNDRVQRVAKRLSDPEVKLICHFVSFAMKPFNTFSTAFQTHASRIGTLQSDVYKLLQTYMSNFIEPKVLQESDNVTTVDFKNADNQLSDDELGIGTSTRLLLCGELEDDIVGTRKEARFFSSVRTFYETAVSKILAKFPFADETIKEFAFLDPRNREKTTVTGLIGLANRFTTFTADEIDDLVMEYRDYRATSDSALPRLATNEHAALDHFWAAVAEIHSVTDSETYRFGVLARLAKTLLILPHSNADPERLFSMVRKIDTDQRKHLDISTLCALLSVKINNDNPCYDNQALITPHMISNAKSATIRSLQNRDGTSSTSTST